MKRFYLLLALLLFALPAHAATVNITWTAPTRMTDGTTITTPITYKLYRGTSAASLTLLVTTPAGALGYQDTNAPAGDVFYAVSAVVGGVESARTGPVTINIPAPAPNPPTGLTLSVVVADTNAYKLRQGVDGFSFVAIGTVPAGTACLAQTVGEYAVVPRGTVKLANRFDVLPLITFAKCA